MVINSAGGTHTMEKIVTNPMAAADWQAALAQTWQQIIGQLIAIIPQLIVAVTIVAIGWIVAYAAANGAKKLLSMMGMVLGKLTTSMPATHTHKPAPAQIEAVGKIVFWLIMLFFIVAAASALGLSVFTNLITSVVAYLPKILVGLVIFVCGYWLAGIANSLTTAAMKSAGLGEAALLGGVVQVLLLITTLVIGTQQLGIDIDFLTELLTVILGVSLAGFSLAFGFGARQMVANVIGAQQLRKHCRIGDRIKLAQAEGIVIDITATIVVVDSDLGRVTIPASKFQERIATIEVHSGSVDSKQ